MANSPADNIRMLEMVSAAQIPTVGFCMGELGTISRILCGRAGSPFTYASSSRERELAPGQLSYAEVRNLYRYNKITKDTKVFGVIGDGRGCCLCCFVGKDLKSNSNRSRHRGVSW